MILRTNWNPCLSCDRCGLSWTEGTGAAQLRDNAKARGWRQRNRYGAVRDYCPACAATIDARERARHHRH
jgi:hypothetical protein